MKYHNSHASRDALAGKILKVSFAAALFFVGFLFVFKLIVPSAGGGWSVMPIIDYIIISGFMFCFVCMAAIYSFQAWTKDVEEYYEWLISLGLLRTAYSRFVNNLYSKGMYLWSARLIPVIILLFVCVFVVVIRS